MIPEQLDSHMQQQQQQKNLIPNLISYEILLKIDMDLNVKLKTIKILEIKARENLYDVKLGKDYLDKHWKYSL